ncbi:MAG: h16 [Symbiobacteriaceae bacterium]|nr:h16 [Symbiobacteriaceae bacterium]
MTSMTASEQIDEIIAGLPDWRGTVLARIRKLIVEADPDITEEIKWRGAPVWSHNGNICVVNAFKEKVKLTFPDGAKLPDPDNLFNNGLDGNQWRAIDIFEQDQIDEESLKTLIRAAVDYCQNKAGAKSPTKPRTARSKQSD